MPAKSTRTITLLLNQNVESLGIVGDVVTVKPGYARNFLLPLGIAEAPTDERVESLKAARADALAELEKVRGVRKPSPSSSRSAASGRRSSTPSRR